MEGQKDSQPHNGNASQSNSVVFDSKNIYKTRAGRPGHDLRDNLGAHTRQREEQRRRRSPQHLLRQKLSTLSRRQKFIALIIAVCIVLGLAAAIILPQLQPSTTGDDEDIDDTPVEESALAVESAYVNGGYDAMIAEYQRLIDSTDDNVEKSSYYAERASDVSDLYDANTTTDPDTEEPVPVDNDLAAKYKAQILADALKAEELAPSSVTALALYSYYDLFGDTDNSEHYKQVALERDPEAIEEDNDDKS